jgi:DNA-binding GntR family transcriptional regulator
VSDSKADSVYRQLRGEIEAGTLAPGSPLGELAVVARTGASRTPVREALRRLAADGLVELTPRQGARVSRVSLRNVRDLFDLRTLLEPEAMRQVAAATVVDAGLRTTLTGLRTEFTRIQRRSPSAARSASFYELADRFDWTVVAACGNEHLRRVLAELRPHTARLRNLSHVDAERIEVSVVEHLAMCDALLAGDAEAAGTACAEHLTQSLRTIVRTLVQGAGSGLLDDLDLLG